MRRKEWGEMPHRLLGDVSLGQWWKCFGWERSVCNLWTFSPLSIPLHFLIGKYCFSLISLIDEINSFCSVFAVFGGSKKTAVALFRQAPDYVFNAFRQGKTRGNLERQQPCET